MKISYKKTTILLSLILFILLAQTEAKKTYSDLHNCKQNLLKDQSSDKCNKECEKNINKCLKDMGEENEDIKDLDSCKSYYKFMEKNNADQVSEQHGADFHGCVYWCIMEYSENQITEMFLLKYKDCFSSFLQFQTLLALLVVAIFAV